MVISGIETKHMSYARVVHSSQVEDKHESAPNEEQATLETQVLSELSKHGVHIKPEDISVCHTLGKAEANRKSPIVIRLISRKTKIEILRNAKRLREFQIYINEHLTKKNATIARQARILRKQQKIISTWTRNCKVFVKFNTDSEHTQIMAISAIEELDRFK